jgi:hypothetical protein
LVVGMTTIVEISCKFCAHKKLPAQDMFGVEQIFPTSSFGELQIPRRNANKLCQ